MDLLRKKLSNGTKTNFKNQNKNFSQSRKKFPVTIHIVKNNY